MSAITSLLTSLIVKEESPFVILERTEFPSNPTIGYLAFVNGVLYIYSTIRSFTTWYPLTNRKKTYIHSQNTPALTWLVRHDLQSEDFIYMIYDSNKNLVVANPANITGNGFDLTFSTAISGKAVIFVDYDEGGSQGDINYYNKSEIDLMLQPVLL